MSQSLRVNLGPVDQVPEGMGRSFLLNGEEIAVFRGRDGRVFAIQNRCPHRRGTLADGVMGPNVVICPEHGHRFDLVTGAGSEPGESVAVYRAEVVGNEIILEYAPGKAGS